MTMAVNWNFLTTIVHKSLGALKQHAGFPALVGRLTLLPIYTPQDSLVEE